MQSNECSEIIAAVSGGMIGSLTMYLFIRIGEISTKIYERQNKNFNALVHLEYLCCENLNNISDDIFVIDDFIETAEGPLKRNEPIIYGNKLSLIPFNDLVLNFSAVDFMNEVLEYKVDITKINHDIQSVNEMYETFKIALIRKDINFSTYKDNALMAIERCKQLKIFLSHLEEKTVRLGSCAGLLARENKPLLTKLIHCFLRKKIFSKEFNKRLEEEIVKRIKSREEVMKRSEEELKIIEEKIRKA